MFTAQEALQLKVDGEVFKQRLQDLKEQRAAQEQTEGAATTALVSMLKQEREDKAAADPFAAIERWADIQGKLQPQAQAPLALMQQQQAPPPPSRALAVVQPPRPTDWQEVPSSEGTYFWNQTTNQTT